MQNTDTLANIVRAVRAEAGHSLSTVQGTNTVDTIKYLVQRTQTELWTAYQWPTLKSRVNIPTVVGQYLYNFPTTPVDVNFEQIRETWAAQTNSVNWAPVAYGIPETLIPADGSNSQAGDFPQFWDVSGDAQFRIWPTPVSAAASVRFVYLRQCTVFVADTDMSTIDATAITLFTAAELLARAKAEDASVKLQKAQKYVLALAGNSVSAKRRVSTLATGAPTRPNRGATPYLDFIPTQHN